MKVIKKIIEKYIQMRQATKIYSMLYTLAFIRNQYNSHVSLCIIDIKISDINYICYMYACVKIKLQ